MRYSSTILVIILAIAFFFSCNSSRKKQIAAIEKSMAISVKIVDENIQEYCRRGKSLLADNTKMKYSKLGEGIDSINAFFMDARTAINQLKLNIINPQISGFEIKTQIKDLQKNNSKTKAAAFKVYCDNLKNDGETYGLKPKEITKMIQEKSVEIDSITTIEEWEYSDGELQMLLIKTELDMANLQFCLIKDLTLIIGGPVISCYFGYYPVVLPKQNCVKKGESFEASIGLVPYEKDFAPSDVELTVDGVPIEFEQGWYVSFKTQPIYKDDKVIKLSCKIKDGLTNKMLEAFTDFEYKIMLCD